MSLQHHDDIRPDNLGRYIRVLDIFRPSIATSSWTYRHPALLLSVTTISRSVM